MKRFAVLPFLMLILLPGCVSRDPDPSFDQVRQTVSDRSGYSVQWDRRRAMHESRDSMDEMLSDDELEAEEAVKLALVNNAQLQAELDELGIAYAELVQASLLPNPVLDAEVKFIEGGGGEIIELAISQGLIETLMVPRRKSLAKVELAKTEANVSAAVLDLIAQTLTSYYRLQAAQARAELYQSVVNASFLSADMARRLREAGNIKELEKLREDAMFSDARLQLASAQLAVTQRRAELNALMGLWGPSADQWDVLPRLADPSALDVDGKSVIAEALEASLDLEAERLMVNQLAKRLGIERIESIFPHAEAGVAAEREADGTWLLGPSAGVALPVFDLGQGVRDEYKARISQALNRYHARAVNLRQTTLSAYTSAAATANNVRYIREVLLPQRHRITQHTQEQFNAMQIGVFQLLSAKQEEINAAERYLTSLENHYAARIRLQTILMGRVPERRYGIDSMSVGGNGGMSESTMQNQGGH